MICKPSVTNLETCGCGRVATYLVKHDGKAVGACNKYIRCLTREEAVEALRIANTRLLNLLATIHRDGGHHTMGVGVERSMLDAENALTDMLRAVDQVESERRARFAS